MKKLAISLIIVLAAACAPKDSNSEPKKEEKPAAKAQPATPQPSQAAPAKAKQEVKEVAQAPKAAAPAQQNQVAQKKPAADQEASKPLLGASADEVVAKVNGVAITEAELMRRLEGRLGKIRTQIFNLKRQGVQGMIEEKLLEAEATRQGKTTQELLKVEISDKLAPISDEEAQAFYNSNKRRFRNKPYEEVSSQVKNQLKSQQANTLRNNLLNRLKENAKIEFMLEVPRVNVSADDDPSKGGGSKAAVTIIEFTDYQCPFCARVRPTIKQILDTYGDKVHYVLRDFPLSFHKEAGKAAEAATCAGDQGKYWEYSDLLWQNQRSLAIPKLKEYANQIGLDQGKFDKCLDGGTHAAEVRKDMSDGSKAGVSGTPSFFVNGQMLSGAQPFQSFKEIIDMELMQKKPNG